jgi:hypothetical protein
LTFSTRHLAATADTNKGDQEWFARRLKNLAEVLEDVLVTGY